MQDATFTLPNLPEADMSLESQERLILNQATAVIISAYLEHATAIHGQLLDDGQNYGSPTLGAYRFHDEDFVALINDVRAILTR